MATWTPPEDAVEAVAWTPPADAVVQEKPSMLEATLGAGSPIARVAKGAIVDPIMGMNQMLAQMFPDYVKQGATSNVQAIEQTVQEERKRLGSEGFDWYQLLGNVISPTNKIAHVAPGLTLGQKAVQSAKTGAALASLQPVTSGDVGEEKLKQMVMGATLGPLTEGGIKGIGFLSEKLKTAFSGFTEKGREDAMRKYIASLAGKDQDKVIQALQDARELVTGSRPTVAEALSNVPTAAELIAAQSKLSSKQGLVGMFAERSTEQQAARVRELAKISGTEAQRAAVATTRDRVTGSIRETALDRANVAGETLQTIDNQSNTTIKNLVSQVSDLMKYDYNLPYTIDDLTRVNKGVANSVKQAQLQSLEQNGVFPVLVGDIIKPIDQAIKTTVGDQNKAVLKAVRDNLISKADDNGIINSRDLYENIRKMSNQDIAKLLGLGDNYASGGIPEQAAKALGNVKKFIDASLNKSSNGLWSKYLDNYKAYSTKLDRMEIGNYLSKRLETSLDHERAGVFATAVENAAQTIKKSTGFPRFNNLSDVLTPKEVASVNNVLADLTRKSKAQELAGKAGVLAEGVARPEKAVPSLLSVPVTVFKEVLSYMHQGNQQKFNQKLSELMLNPADMAKFMTTIPKNRVNDLTSAMMQMMDESTRRVFIQSFTVPATSATIGND